MRGQTVAVFGSSRTENGSLEWERGESLGKGLAESGLGVATGGYGGTMEAVSKGAADAGGRVIGVIAPSLFPDRPGANPYVNELVEAEDLMTRIGALLSGADAVIALPGSIGTAAELLVAWNINYISRYGSGRRLPTVAVGRGWRVVTETLTREIGALPGDIELVDTHAEALVLVLDAIETRQH